MNHSEPDQPEIPFEALVELFAELFTEDFIESLPPGHIAQTIENLRLLESSPEPLPREWAALKQVLQIRGLLE